MIIVDVMKTVLKITFYIILNFFLSFVALSQISKATKRDVDNGLILFRFVPENSSYYCALKPKIKIDSIWYDFIPIAEANHSIIENNKQFIQNLGNASTYIKDFFVANAIVYQPVQLEQFKKSEIDSVLSAFSKYNIYDTVKYKPHCDKYSELTISSSCIYRKEQSDSLFVALSLSGSVILYENVDFGKKTDYRLVPLENGSTYFDRSHGKYPFQVYDRTIIVLDTVRYINEIQASIQEQLCLQKSKGTEIKVFVYE